MKHYQELTEDEQQAAVTHELDALLVAVIEGAVHFDDTKNGDTLQASIDAAGEAAEANRTPWFMGEYIMEADFTDADGNTESVEVFLRAMAVTSAEDALYSGQGEHVIAGIAR